ncbi:MAG TPA: lipopolysaccharide heptosyltransferase II [Phycisphaerae bacterium]|nr:lipopolysaccharide heptosyltransferase II [Phycisphaerae bacterium]
MGDLTNCPADGAPVVTAQSHCYTVFEHLPQQLMAQALVISPRRIVISIPNWVGDVVMATPALAAVRRGFPNTHITHLMRSYVADVLAGTKLADGTIFWPDKGNAAAPRGIASLLRILRQGRFDLGILLTNSFRSAIVMKLGGVKRRVGYARDGRSWLLTDRLRPQREDGSYIPVPALDYYNEIARSLGCEGVGDQMMLATNQSDEDAVDRRLTQVRVGGPLVVLNPGANYGAAKCWPPEYYAQLADELGERFGARVVASLSPKESWIAERLKAALRRPIEIFIDPPLGLGPLKALIRRCQLLITNDTGPRHFAAAFGVPVVTIFGSSDPAWTDTRYPQERIVKLDLDCQPCMERTCPLKHHRCMKELMPAMVMEKIEEFLSPGSRPRIMRGARA